MEVVYAAYETFVRKFDPNSDEHLDMLNETMQGGPWLSFVEFDTTGVKLQDSLNTTDPLMSTQITPLDGKSFGRADIVKILARSRAFRQTEVIRWIDDTLKGVRLDPAAILANENNNVRLIKSSFYAMEQQYLSRTT